MIVTDGSTGARALGDALAAILQAPAQLAATFADALAKRGSPGCEIPPPCWEPRPAGVCSLELAPGTAATIRVHVSNCGWGRQVVGITSLGKLAAWMTFAPTTLVLGPQERATIAVTLRVPDAVKAGQSFVASLLVRGCLDHVARVDISIAECAVRNCCDIVVNDCPDNIHHWYDHFYCQRPCRNLHDFTTGR